MPLPEAVIREALERVVKAKKLIEDMEDVLNDLRASGLDTARQEEMLRHLREGLRKWESFYELQSKRPPE